MFKTTKTLNPLPFEALEPQRFEDLIRQLIYDFRNWKSIEALGRTGSDEGIDIRAIESAGTIHSSTDEEDEDLLIKDDVPDTKEEVVNEEFPSVLCFYASCRSVDRRIAN